ncbi:hypothetical protein HX882_02935 [Pseudomonas gingeri]|uniref:Uncharacterized protein n=1 Tax=Pseudomonas gingeri TaxID=117681 RepID=A0A7Y7XA10_9PSED|nr:hypothetical protein [Pseudomonas gingeri]NWB94843.1 hypothetical protein [Pseudomonas gingeri]
MAHSADYQFNLYIKELELVAQTLTDQASRLKESGHDTLAEAASKQADQLIEVIAELQHLMEI